MKPSLFLLFLCCCYHLLAGDILLDSVMSPEEQRSMGINKLSPLQKMQLENWLNNTFILKPSQTSTSKPLFLSLNIDNGKKIQLSDNSLWEIDPADVKTSIVWITPFPVVIQPSDSVDYPVLIINETTGNKVKAKKVG